MAENISLAGILPSPMEVAKSFWETMPTELFGPFSFIINLIKIIGILVIIYLLFLLVRAIVQIRQAKHIRLLSKNVGEINQKLDLLLGKSKDKKEDKDPKKSIEKKKN